MLHICYVIVFRAFIEEKLGAKYTERKSIEFAKSFEESNKNTPIFFILSPGVNPLNVNLHLHFLEDSYSLIIALIFLVTLKIYVQRKLKNSV